MQIRTHMCHVAHTCICGVAVHELGEVHVLDTCKDARDLHTIVRLARDVTVPEQAVVTANNDSTAYTVSTERFYRLK